jgi:DNA-binding NarL/FixJ family response regulator
MLRKGSFSEVSAEKEKPKSYHSCAVSAKEPRLLVKELQPQGPVALMEQLGERERSMLQLVAQGYNASEIAAYYDIRSDSVRRCLSQAYQRIGVRDRAQAVGWCLSHGIVTRQELDRLYRPSLEPPAS